MALTIFHDPLHDLTEVFDRIFPGHSAQIVFGGELKEGHGVTIFGEGVPQVVISSELPYLHCAEILAHELAHVVAGHDADHGPEWEAAFESLHAGYLEKIQASGSIGTDHGHQA